MWFIIIVMLLWWLIYGYFWFIGYGMGNYNYR